MVIRIVMTIAGKKMTIAATLKNGLKRAGNSGAKGEKRPYFVKGCYFHGPHGAQNRLRGSQKPSWFDENFWKIHPEKRLLQLYIYTLVTRVLHKYTVACKGFSQFAP